MTYSPATSPTSREVIQARTIRTLSIAQVLSGVGVAGTVAAGSLLVSTITDSETLAGLAQTFSVLGAATMALPLAKLTRTGGRRLALASGYFTGALGAAFAVVGGTTSFLPIMLLGTFLVGAASASGYQARYAAVDLSDADSRAGHLSVVVWASTVGAVLGPNLMSPFGRVAKVLGLPELTGPYVLAAAMLLVGSTLIWTRLVPDPYLTSLQGTSETDAVSHVKLPLRDTFAYLRTNRAAYTGMLAIAVGHIAMVSVMVMTPVHMKHVDVSLRIIGLVISVHVAGMYAFSPIVGKFTDKFGRVRVIQAGVLILLASTAVAGVEPTYNSVQLGIGLFLLGLGWSCTLVAGSTLLSESVSEHYRASVQGTSDLVMNLAGAGGGALAGIIIATLSYGWLCAIAAIPIALLGVLTVRNQKTVVTNV